jgi:hypothetical protein
MHDTNTHPAGVGPARSEDSGAEIDSAHWLELDEARRADTQDGAGDVDCVHWLESSEL